jgi:hypothetical protein
MNSYCIGTQYAERVYGVKIASIGGAITGGIVGGVGAGLAQHTDDPHAYLKDRLKRIAIGVGVGGLTGGLIGHAENAKGYAQGSTDLNHAFNAFKSKLGL